MAETILRQGIRGLARAFGLPGGRTGPPGLELGIPAQTVAELGQFARYGASSRPELGDGWIYWANDLPMLTGINYYSTSVPLTDLEALLGAGAAGGTFWVYRAQIFMIASAAVADYNRAGMTIITPSNSRLGAGTGTEIPIYHSNPATLDLISALSGWVVPRNHFNPKGPPTPMPQGSSLFITGETKAAAGTVTLYTGIFGRYLPSGVPPLP